MAYNGMGEHIRTIGKQRKDNRLSSEEHGEHHGKRIRLPQNIGVYAFRPLVLGWQV